MTNTQFAILSSAFDDEIQKISADQGGSVADAVRGSLPPGGSVEINRELAKDPGAARAKNLARMQRAYTKTVADTIRDGGDPSGIPSFKQVLARRPPSAAQEIVRPGSFRVKPTAAGVPARPLPIDQLPR